MERQDFRGGVVDGAEQGHARAAALEPVVRAAVDLHELPRGVFAGATTTMLRGAPAVDGGEPECPPQPADGLARDRQLMKLAQLFCDVGVIEACVAAVGARRWCDTRPRPSCRRAAAPPMRNRCLSRWNWRAVMWSAAAPCRLVICPATAAATSPGRGTSFRLIVKVSIGGRHFHGAVTPRHFYVAVALAARCA